MFLAKNIFPIEGKVKLNYKDEDNLVPQSESA